MTADERKELKDIAAGLRNFKDATQAEMRLAALLSEEDPLRAELLEAMECLYRCEQDIRDAAERIRYYPKQLQKIRQTFQKVLDGYDERNKDGRTE
jgi:hypothetical protein